MRVARGIIRTANRLFYIVYCHAESPCRIFASA
jgi:hypothetical protein